jgi:hypothetical protein
VESRITRGQLRLAPGVWTRVQGCCRQLARCLIRFPLAGLYPNEMVMFVPAPSVAPAQTHLVLTTVSASRALSVGPRGTLALSLAHACLLTVYTSEREVWVAAASVAAGVHALNILHTTGEVWVVAVSVAASAHALNILHTTGALCRGAPRMPLQV